jgi:transcriptional regulator with XRE-family HTH domain
MNEGARQLDGKNLKGSAAVAALAGAGLKVTRMTVSRWSRGKSVPDDAARDVLASALGIPVPAWDLEPAVPTAKVSRPSKHKPPRGKPRPPPSPLSLDMPTAAALAKEALAAVQMLQIQLESSTLSIEGRKKLGDMLGAAIDRYAKYSGQGAPEKDLVNSPQWARLSDMLVGALVKHPEAARAVQAVLRAAR